MAVPLAGPRCVGGCRPAAAPARGRGGRGAIRGCTNGDRPGCNRSPSPLTYRYGRTLRGRLDALQCGPVRWFLFRCRPVPFGYTRPFSGCTVRPVCCGAPRLWLVPPGCGALPSAGGSSGAPPQAPGPRSSPPTGPEAPQPRCGTRPLLATPQGAVLRCTFIPGWFSPPAPGRASRAAVLPARPPPAAGPLPRAGPPPGPPCSRVVRLPPAALGCRAAVGGRPLFPWSVSLAGPPLVGHRRPALLGAAFSVAALSRSGSPSFPPRPLPPLGEGGARGWFGAGSVLSLRVRSFWVGAGAH